MKNWMVLVLIILLILVSGLAGYFLRKPEKVVEPEPIIVIRPDREHLLKIDSLEFVVKVLKTELAKSKIRHEKNTASVDSLPAPELFRKIADYYNKQ